MVEVPDMGGRYSQALTSSLLKGLRKHDIKTTDTWIPVKWIQQTDLFSNEENLIYPSHTQAS